MNEREDTKRVAKNTLILYGRMIVMTLIGLYTSRVILEALGIEDYGINNAVGGFLSMFSIVTVSMTSAVNRFITVELGHDNPEKRQKVFATAVSVMVIMGIVMMILIESIGLWFLNNELNIPASRSCAANFLLHISALGVFITLFMVPYNASIVAHEKMSAFAYFSILDALSKLAICYVIYISPFDKLMTYSTLGFITTMFMEFIYFYYCKKKFDECRYNFTFEKSIFKEIWEFASWNFFGQASWMLNTQGVNILINIFFGVNFNAARGIAEQVNQKVTQFASGFMTSLNPQITKSYAAGNKEYAYKLACRGARYSFYIIYILALPIMLESNQILHIWLKTPPDYSDIFVIWTIISTLIIALGSTLVTLQLAHGDIKRYQIIMTTIGSVPFPAIWLFFKFGAQPVVAYWVFCISYWILIFVRFMVVNQSTGIPAKMYLYGVILKCHIVAIVSAIIPVIIVTMMEPSIIRMLIIGITSSVLSCIAIYYWGIEKEERTFILAQIRKRIPFLRI